jgi:hypothetical protein
LFPGIEDYRTGGGSGGPVEDFPALPRTQAGLGDMGGLAGRGMTSRLLPQLDGILGQPQGAIPPGETEKKVVGLRCSVVVGGLLADGCEGHIETGHAQRSSWVDRHAGYSHGNAAAAAIAPLSSAWTRPSQPATAATATVAASTAATKARSGHERRHSLLVDKSVSFTSIPSSRKRAIQLERAVRSDEERYRRRFVVGQGTGPNDVGFGYQFARVSILVLIPWEIFSWYTSGALWPSFSSPFAELESTAVEPDFQLPQCYTVVNTQPVHSKIGSFSDETLFYIFYTMPRDIMQEVVVAEL